MGTEILLPDIRLLVIKGHHAGKVYETNRFPIYIGRDRNTDFSLEDDNNVSRKHAVIDSDESKVWIKDLKSTNGTFVNNIRITKKTELTDGTEFIIGNSWIKYVTISLNKRAEIAEEESDTFINIPKKREAIFVLDLHDSSKIADEYGDDAVFKIKKRVNKITIPIANHNKAVYIKGTGDGFLITFEKAESALVAATQIIKMVNQNNLKKKNKDKIYIRIGLNYGNCNLEPNGDRIGLAVNVAFRVEGVKYTDMLKDKSSVSRREFIEFNRIFITEGFYRELKGEKYAFKALGSFKLKGIRGSHRLYLVK